jgi:hypothetical protein
MKMRSDAPKVIQNVTSATAELLSTRELNIINLIARRVEQGNRPQPWHIYRNSKVAGEAHDG